MHHVAGPYLYQYEYLFKGLLLWSPKKTLINTFVAYQFYVHHMGGGEKEGERKREGERERDCFYSITVQTCDVELRSRSPSLPMTPTHMSHTAAKYITCSGYCAVFVSLGVHVCVCVCVCVRMGVCMCVDVCGLTHMSHTRSKYVTCNGYCAAVGRQCTAAWEEVGDTCQVSHDMRCKYGFLC